MQRVKKQKKRPSKKIVQGKEAWEYVKQTELLMINIFIRTMWTVYGWRRKRIMDFLEANLALLQEVADGRTSVQKMGKDTKEITGIDAEELLNELYK